MSKNRWLGGAPNLAQVQTVTIGVYDVTTTYKVTIGSQTISQIGTGGTAATTAAALVALLQASTIQMFKEITWTINSNVITGTAATAGYPFTVNVVTSGGTGTISTSITTANSGPNDASVTANWSLGVLPVNGDDIYFDQGSYDVLYGLNQSSVTPNSINIYPGFSGKIGLPKINSVNVSATYYEYRPDYLQYGATTVLVNNGSGAGRIKLDNGSTAVTWNVLGTGNRAESSVPTLLLKGSNSANVLNQSKGDVALAWFVGETTGLGTLNVGYQTSIQNDSKLWCGPDVTFTNCAIVQTGGTLAINSTISSTGSVLMYNGTLTFGTGTTAGIAQLTGLGGTLIYNGSGTLGGTTKLGGKFTLDFSQDLRAKTVTNPIEKYGADCRVLDPNAVVNSGAMAIGYNEGADTGIDDYGRNFRLTRSASP
jgi:hypothetical protein